MRASRLLSLVVLVAVLASLPTAGQVATSIVGTQVYPASAAVDTLTNTIFVANNCGSDSSCTVGTNPSVTVINGATLATQTVGVGYWPFGVAVDSGFDHIYVGTCGNDDTCSSLGGVSAIYGNTLSVTNVTTTGYLPSWVAVNPSSHYVYAVNECDDPNYPNCTTMGNVTVINGGTIQAVATVQAGAYAYSAAVNAITNMIYVVNECGSDLTCQSPGSVTVINGSTNTVVATLAVDVTEPDAPARIAQACAAQFGEADVLVMNGDVLTDVDYGALLERHRASDAAATIATKTRTIQVSLGVLRFGDAGDDTRLTGYDEKPTIDYVASMGVYCFAPRALSFIEPGERLDFPDLILRLIAAGEIVRSWPSEDYWLDIGRHDDYEQAQEEFESVRERLLPGE